MNENNEQISIALDYYYPQKVGIDGSFRSVNTIPKSCIHKIVRIKMPTEINEEVNKNYLNKKEKQKK